MGRVEDKWCSTDTRFDQRPLILQKSMVKPSSRSLAWVEPLLLTGAAVKWNVVIISYKRNAILHL